MQFIFGFLIGFGFTCVCFKLYLLYLQNGVFKIDTTNDAKDYYTLYVDDFGKLDKRRYLLLKIGRITRK